jgi:hypothetical protein
MSATQETPVLTTEQQQRLTAAQHAGAILRNGGATPFANSAKAGEARDIIDLANYITTGVPFAVAWGHEHECNPAVTMDMVGPFEVVPGSSLFETLASIFEPATDEKKDDALDFD